MTLVVDQIRTLLPAGSRLTPSGWITLNAPCCHHRGHRSDTKRRGGIRFDQGVVYHCFNCQFTTGWQPGNPIGEKLKQLVSWMGGSQELIHQLIIEALRTEKSDYDPAQDTEGAHYQTKQLPEHSISLIQALEQNPEQAVPVADYVLSRGHLLDSYNFMWSASMPDRVILPFWYQSRLVGYTARRIDDRKPKYLTSQNPHMVFNIDSQSPSQRYLFVCEGPFDALAIGGVAVLSNHVSQQQAHLINGLGCEVILVPDLDQAGMMMVDQAIEFGWSVAFPHWDPGIKDCAQAVQRYGQLFVVVDAIRSAQHGEIKIVMAKKKLLQQLNKNINVDALH
jgi:hypothetical protein